MDTGSRVHPSIECYRMQVLCRLNELKNHQSKGFNLNGEALFVVRQNQQVRAYRNRCPHLGIQLERLPDRFLNMNAELIQCSTHGALFTIDEGLCVSGPCSGQSLETITCTVSNGLAHITLQPQPV